MDDPNYSEEARENFTTDLSRKDQNQLVLDLKYIPPADRHGPLELDGYRWVTIRGPDGKPVMVHEKDKGQMFVIAYSIEEEALGERWAWAFRRPRTLPNEPPLVDGDVREI